MRRSSLRLHFRDGNESFPSRDCCNVVDVRFNEEALQQIRRGTKQQGMTDACIAVRLCWEAKETFSYETLSTITPHEGEDKSFLAPEYSAMLFVNQHIIYDFAQDMYEVYNAKLIAIQHQPFALIFHHTDGFSASIFTSAKYRLHAQLKKFLSQSMPSKQIQLQLKITKGAKIAIPKCQLRQCSSTAHENPPPKVKVLTADIGSQTERCTSSAVPDIKEDVEERQSKEFDERFLVLSRELLEQHEVLQSEIQRRKREYEEIRSLLVNLTSCFEHSRSPCPTPAIRAGNMQCLSDSLMSYSNQCNDEREHLRNFSPQRFENVGNLPCSVEDLIDDKENYRHDERYQRQKLKSNGKLDRKVAGSDEEDGDNNEVNYLDQTMKPNVQAVTERTCNEGEYGGGSVNPPNGAEFDTNDERKIDRGTVEASDDTVEDAGRIVVVDAGRIVGEDADENVEGCTSSFPNDEADDFDTEVLHGRDIVKSNLISECRVTVDGSEHENEEEISKEDHNEKPIVAGSTGEDDDGDEEEEEEEIEEEDDNEKDEDEDGEEEDVEEEMEEEEEGEEEEVEEENVVEEEEEEVEQEEQEEEEVEEGKEGKVEDKQKTEYAGDAYTNRRSDVDTSFKDPVSCTKPTEDKNIEIKRLDLPEEADTQIPLQTTRQMDRSISLPRSDKYQRDTASLSPLVSGGMSSSLPISRRESLLSPQNTRRVVAVNDVFAVTPQQLDVDTYGFGGEWQSPFSVAGKLGMSGTMSLFKKDMDFVRQTLSTVKPLIQIQREQSQQTTEFMSSKLDAADQFLKLANIIIGPSQRMSSYSDIQVDQLNLDVERAVFSSGKPGVNKNRISDEPDGEHRLRILIESMIGTTSDRERLWESIENALSQAESVQPYVENVLDTVICLDTSDSMTGDAFKQMKTCVMDFINGIEDIADQHELEENIAIVTFGGRAIIKHGLSNDYGSLRDTIDELTPSGPSPVLEGILVSLACLSKGGELNLEGIVRMPPRLILISDGLATGELPPHSTDVTTTDAQEMNILENAFGQLAKCQPADVLQGQTVVVHVGDTSKIPMFSLSRMCGGQFCDKKDVRKLCNHQRIYKHAADVFEELHTDGPCNLMRFMSSVKTLSERIESELGNTDAEAACILVTQHMDRVIIQYDSFTTFTNVLEVSELPPLGTRVVRGSDWKWENQDTEGAGTIFNHGTDGKYLWVLWDNGLTNVYRYGKYGCYDVKISDQILEPSGNMEVLIGLKVERGPNWNVTYGDQDGGQGGHGVIIREKKKQGRVLVRWQRGAVCEYRFGENNMYDLAIVSEQNAQTLRKDSRQ